MSCCGDKLAKAVNIVEGYTELAKNAVLKAMFDVEVPPDSKAAKRYAICEACGQQAWLTTGEYYRAIKKYGLDLIKEFADLSNLPPLPCGKKAEGKICSAENANA